jgi:putative colanic acid biosynthesis acetyltransferase WcaF
MNVRLSQFNNSWYDPGRGLFGRTLWYFANALVLRVFGAKIGHGVVLKPCINIKYPWNIDIGNDSWIGENAWLDSLALIKIGSNVCVSQGAYLCTGNHDWSDPAFGLVVKTIVVEDGAWIGAMATVPPGVTIASHSVVTAGSVIVEDTEPYGIYAGNPAVKIKDRKIR